MKTPHIILALTLLATSSAAKAQGPVISTFSSVDTVAVGLDITDVSMKRASGQMNVSMTLGLSDLKMKGDRAIVYTPLIVAESDTLALTPVSLYGRTRWIQYRRNGRVPSGVPAETAYKFSDRPAVMEYSESVPWQPWMNNAELIMRRDDYGCCNRLLDAADADLARYHQVAYIPVFRYMRPVGSAPKHRELEGQAFVDFPVDQTIIYPEYRRNTAELDSIRRTIDVVRNDPDATIETVWLKGFASPESPYQHNTELAIGRTEALKKYIQGLYHFDSNQILTDYEPEDWEGLRRAVAASSLEHRDQILAIIDSDLAPDPKEWKIKSTYPDEYRFMLENFYPPLRHTNYKVSYVVRSYSTPEEIFEIMKTRPGHLSLGEFYTAASTLEPGSDAFNDVFETAARIYPNDPDANINAANAAMNRGDYSAAARYLAMAGNSADADYARAVLATLTEQYDDARSYLSSALAKGFRASDDELSSLRDILDL